MIKYGTDAEYYGKKPFGFGAGIGYRVAAALIEISDDDGFTGIYSTPTAVAEVSLRAGFLGLLKARFVVDLSGAAIETKGTFDLHYYGLYLTSTKNF
jgi:hypothetical protein